MLQRLLRLLLPTLAALLVLWGGASGVQAQEIPSLEPPAMDTTGLEHLQTPELDVWVTPEARAGFQKVLERTRPQHERLRQNLGVERLDPIRVVVLEDLNEYFARRGVPARAPQWAVGLAISADDTLLVKWGRSEAGTFVDLDKTFIHELAHIELDRRVGADATHIHGHEHVDHAEQPGRRRVPRWFHEGFAIAMAGEWTLERSQALMEAGLGGRIISLHELREGFPAEGFAVELAYAESYHFLLYLDDRFGPEKRVILIKHMAQGESFEDAFFAAYKVEFGRVEMDWHDRLNVTYTWIPVALGSSLFWFAAGVIFILAWARKRRQRQAAMEAMEDGFPESFSHLPLPGMGLSERDVRGRSRRVFYDGSWIPADHEAAEALDDGSPAPPPPVADESLGDLLRPTASGSGDVPRTPDGHTLH